MSKDKFEIKINVPMIKELVSDKIYRSDASAFREQYVNALSHGCMSYHEEHGYTDDVYVHVVFDYGHRKVTITDNGQGMSKNVFSDNFMSFGFSTVDKETNNTRSGMFGLGAISFFRIASACIVESWNRKDDERFTFMTRNTDESEFVTNRTLESPGTKTEIYLKDHVNIDSLITMVESIASNYPVKTILETVNSEGQQSVATYQKTDQDRYETFERIEKFEDYVSLRTSGKYVTIVDNDEMELYLSTTGGNSTNTYLCRIPIGMAHRTGFTTFINIKKEKIPGTDSFGKPKLQEVPKPDRDEVHERAFDYFTEKIDKLIDDLIHAIDIKTFEEYQASPERWIVSGYSVDDKLNPLTHQFVQQLRHTVKYRTINGIQKRFDSLLNILSKTDNVFFHSSLHKNTFDTIHEHIGTDEELIFVNDTNDLPIQDAKQYKKDNKLKSINTSSKSPGIGFLVRDGTYNTRRIKNEDDTKKLWPGGVYYADNIINQYNISISRTNRFVMHAPIMKTTRRHKIGLVVAKSVKGKLPSLYTKIDEINKASLNGQIIDQDGAVVVCNDVTDIRTMGDARTTFLPLQWSKFEFMKYLGKETSNSDIRYIFVPSKFLHILSLITQSGDSYESKATAFTKVLKYIPKWYEKDPEILAAVLSNYTSYFRFGYSEIPVELHGELLTILIDLKINKSNIGSEEFEELIKSICSKYEESYENYNYNSVYMDYDKIFPQNNLKEIAKEAGYNKTTTSKDGEHVYGYKLEDDNREPIEINGKYYVKVNMIDGENVRAVIDDNGDPIIIEDISTTRDVVMHEGKLQFKKEITKWT